MARHFNYMGEGVLSFSIGLIFGHFTNPWAWIYFVLIVTLFTFRQRDDDRHCAEKYGAEKWAEYKARVKYRIFPGVYGVDPPASRFCQVAERGGGVPLHALDQSPVDGPSHAGAPVDETGQ